MIHFHDDGSVETSTHMHSRANADLIFEYRALMSQFANDPDYATTEADIKILREHASYMRAGGGKK